MWQAPRKSLVTSLGACKDRGESVGQWGCWNPELWRFFTGKVMTRWTLGFPLLSRPSLVCHGMPWYAHLRFQRDRVRCYMRWGNFFTSRNSDMKSFMGKKMLCFFPSIFFDQVRQWIFYEVIFKFKHPQVPPFRRHSIFRLDGLTVHQASKPKSDGPALTEEALWLSLDSVYDS